MKAIIILNCLLATAVVGCGASSSSSSSEPGQVAAGFYPLAFAAREIAPRGIQVSDLTPPGAEPHDLEPRPRDVARVQSADHVFLLGHGFQPQLEGAAGGKASKLLDTPGLVLRGEDPHVWLDPRRYALLARRIGAELRQEGRAERFAERLRRLDRKFHDGLADCRRRTIVTSHEAFGYLADRYGLEQVAVSGISPEAEPSPRALERVVGVVRKRGATTVFNEPLLSRRIASTIARETGARVASLNPVESLTESERARGDDYFSLMEGNLAALRTGLGCR